MAELTMAELGRIPLGAWDTVVGRSGITWLADPDAIADALRDREVAEVNRVLAAVGLHTRLHRDGTSATFVGPVDEADTLGDILRDLLVNAGLRVLAALKALGDVPDFPARLRVQDTGQ